MEQEKRNGLVGMSMSGSMIDAEMEVRSQLFIAGSGLGVEEISSRLGLRPSKTSEDSPLREKHRESGYVSWTLYPGHSSAFFDETPDENLHRVLRILEGKSGALKSLRPAVRADLVLGIHLEEDSQVTQVRFTQSTLAKVSELGLDLVLSIV